jgi:AraC family transcriptional regulator, ethanolamine operon transcriptional activator
MDPFRDLIGLSPMTYLKIRRLHGARRELKVARLMGRNVFDIPSNWGFWHMGHFSRDHKALFGESPSETQRRWKATFYPPKPYL